MRYDPEHPICRAGKAIDDRLQGLRIAALESQRPVPYGVILHPEDTMALLALHDDENYLANLVDATLMMYGIHIVTSPDAERGTAEVVPEQQSFLQWSSPQIDLPRVPYATEGELSRTYDSERDSFEHWIQGVEDLLREVRDA